MPCPLCESPHQAPVTLQAEQPGRHVQLADLFQLASDCESCRQQLVIRDATISSIVGENLSFEGSIHLIDCVVMRGGRLWQCTIDGDVRFERCQFNGQLNVEACRIGGAVVLGSTQLNNGLSLLDNSIRAGTTFSRCQFSGDTEIRSASASSSTWNHCRFVPESKCLVTGDHPRAALVDCRLGGELQIKSQAPIEIDLAESTLSGVVDLSEARVRTLNFSGVRVHGGKTRLSTSSLTQDLRGQRLRLPLDRVGPLLSERTLAGITESSPRPMHRDEARASDSLEISMSCEKVAREYAELGRSCERESFGEFERDRCRYKAHSFRWRGQIGRLPRGYYPCGQLAIFALLVVGAALFCRAPFSWFAGALVAGTLLFAVLFRQYAYSLLGAVFEHRVLRNLLGYGLSPPRIAVSGLATILVYAALYWGTCIGGAPVGNILLETPASLQIPLTQDMLEFGVDPLNPDYELVPASSTVICRRCVYFSAVTFCTLGYGDYRPTGRLHWVAASEALLGVFLTALLTVSLARRLL